MTVLSRGARVRRGGRRPGWLLLTALLVLAIGASSALVFTNRVELLKLAVILALWAAVVAAFVSVIYRRQSDVDQARVRDLKLVYDLQLDREISARREYELTVESQLRRELASELRAQAADEVAALRAELAALRTNLEILFDAELDHRPALESERGTVRGYSDWERENESPRDRINRVASVRAEDTRRSEDSSIIDVPEEPLVPPPRQDGYAYQGREPVRGAAEYEAAEAYSASQWREHDRAGGGPQEQQPSSAPWAPPEFESEYRRHARHQYEAPPPAERRFEPPPPPPPEPSRPAWATFDEGERPQRVGVPPQREVPLPTGGDQPQRSASASDWQPVSPEGHWLAPGTSGSNWVSGPPDHNGMTADALSEPRLAAPPPVERQGRHSAMAETMAEGGWPGETGQPEGARHSAEPAAAPSRPEPVMAPPPEPPARHRSADPSADPHAPRSGGQSVADLLARLQASPTGGGRRRRREE